MTPRDAKRWALGLSILNILLGLAISTLAIQWTVDFLLPIPPKKPKVFLGEEGKNAPVEAAKPATIETFQAAWNANILEERRVPTPKKKPPKKNKATERKEATLPYSWVSSIVHSQKQKSFAVLLDKAKGKQILIQYGQLIPGTPYKIISISPTEIKIIWDSMQCTISPPKKEEKQESSPTQYKNKWLGLENH